MPRRFFAWLWSFLGFAYFFIPIYATLEFSLKAKKGVYSLLAYERVFADSRFGTSFVFSAQMAVLTILLCIVLLLPTLTITHLFFKRFRVVLELLALVPFVVPSIILVFGFIRFYSRPPLSLTNTTLGTYGLLLAGYMVLAMPYMYRAIDAGLRAIDTRTLVEAAQSLGASWMTTMLRVIFPNIRVAILNGTFITFAIVMGELTLAQFLVGGTVAFAPYLALLGRARAYEPAALTVISLLLTWLTIGTMQWLGRGQRINISGAR